jgi:defect-in-organelle-trafficking protein DotD
MMPSPIVQPVKPVAAEPDIVSTRLAFAAEKAAAALDTIAGIEQQRTPLMPDQGDYSNAPPALMQLITVNWSGPVEQILEMLSSRTGMSFKVKGSKPAVPLLVTINVYQEPILDVLHNIGLQVGRRADIKVDGINNHVEIRYAPVDRT